MNVREALEKLTICEEVGSNDEQYVFEVLYPRLLAPIIEKAARAAWNKGLADSHRFPVSSDNGVTAFVAAMKEE